MNENNHLGVVVVHYADPEATERCLRSLRGQAAELHLFIVLVENRPVECASPQTTALCDVAVTTTSNLGFARGANLGVSLAGTELVWILNPDVLLDENLGGRMFTDIENVFSHNQSAGMVSPSFRLADGRLQNVAGTVPTLGRMIFGLKTAVRLAPLESGLIREVKTLTAVGVFVRRSVFEALGGFDERYFMYFEDADLSRRMRRQGYSLYWVDVAVGVHALGGSSVGMQDALKESWYRTSQAQYVSIHYGRSGRRLVTILFAGRYVVLRLRYGRKHAHTALAPAIRLCLP